MQRYEAYRDSGVEWIGEIPAGWEVIRSQYAVSLRQNGNWGDEPNGPDEGRFCLRAADFDYEHLRFKHTANYVKRCFNKEKFEQVRLSEGDIVIEKSGGGEKTPVGRALVFRGGFEACYSNFLERLKVERSRALPVFFFYWWTACYQSGLFVNYFNQTTGIQNLNTSALLSEMEIALPPLPEQQAIADYLDEKTAEIDSIVSQTERSIELLREYRKSVISEAVTKGLDPNAPMRDSGVEWIGEIPAGWEVEKIKYRFEITKRIAGYDGPVVLSITQNGIKAKDIESGEGQLASSYANYQWVHIGDFAMNHMDLLTGWVDCSRYEGVTSPDYRVFRATSDEIDKRFYTYLFQHCYSGKVFYGLGQGVSNYGRWRMPADEFNNFPIPVPPLPEQQVIADYLDEKTAEIDSLIAHKQRQVELLREYRKSLISEAVTGKFKVPGLE